MDVGDRVSISGLDSESLNGLCGVITGEQGDRFIVSIRDVGDKALKEENLSPVPEEDNTEDSHISKRSRTTYVILILFCIVGVLFHKATTTRKIEKQFRQLQASELAHEKEIATILHKDITPPPTKAPLTDSDVVRVIFRKVAKSVGKQMFKGGTFVCARLSTAKMLRGAVDSGNVTWVTFGGDIPQSEFMVRCIQKVVKRTSQIAEEENAIGNIFTVMDKDPEANIETFDERRYYRDAMKWVYQKSKSPPPLCGVTFGNYLHELPYEESLMVTNTQGSCREIEELVCKSSKRVVQFGGLRDNSTTSNDSELYQTCFDIIDKMKKKNLASTNTK